MSGFPISLARPAEHLGPLPARADVVVIGGGIIGVCTALFLARSGVRVLLLEKGRIAGEQSSRNWGWVRQQGRDPAELPIMVESLRIWQDLSASLGAELGFRQTGVAYIATSARELGQYEAWLTHARAHRVDSRLLGRKALSVLLPAAPKSWRGALWTASDGRAEPWLAVPALARAAARAGAQLRENCAVRCLDIAAGRVAGVITEAGRVAAARVVLAGGAWSALLARAHGVRLPQLSVRASVAATAPLPEVLAGAAATRDVAFRRRLDGGYTLAPAERHELFIGPESFRCLADFLPQLRKHPFGTRYLPAAPRGFPDAWSTPRRWSADGPSPFEALRILDPRPNLRWLQDARRRFSQAFPDAGEVRLAVTWAGMIDTMPDMLPVIDHAATLPGLTIATGMSGHGFGIGPGIGRVLADLVQGRAPGHDLHPFRLARFSQRPRPRPGPAI